MDSTVSRTSAELRRPHVERLLLGRHDALERGQARARDALVDREHGRERKRDGLGGALEVAPRGAPSFAELEMGDGGDGGKVEQVRRHGSDGAAAGVGRHPAEEDQVVPAVLELGRQRGRDGEPVEGHLVRLELDRSGGAHGERLSEGLLHPVGAEADRHDLTASRLFHQLQRDFEGVAVEVTDLVLEPTRIQRLAVARDGESELHLRHPLETHRDLQRTLPASVLRLPCKLAAKLVAGRSLVTLNEQPLNRCPAHRPPAAPHPVRSARSAETSAPSRE